MNEIVSRRVLEELEASGYEPRLHPPSEQGGAFEIAIPGHAYDVDDLKRMVRMAQTSGAALGLDDRGWITLR